ncbi:MAG TPA: porin family protein [Gammaproteobacteria bacterium]
MSTSNYSLHTPFIDLPIYQMVIFYNPVQWGWNNNTKGVWKMSYKKLKIKITSLALTLISVLPFSVAQADTAYSWDGFYAGASFGLTNFKTDTADYWCWYACDAPGNSEQSTQVTLTGGYNWQLDDNFVLGVEVDHSSGVDSSETIYFNEDADDGVVWKSELEGIMTVRVRAGLTIDRTLLFVTGGISKADAKYDAQEFDPVTDAEDLDYAKFSGSVKGTAFGAGVEHALSDAMRLKLEYVAITNDKKDSCWFVSAGECDNTLPQNDDSVHWVTATSTFRAGVNFNF